MSSPLDPFLALIRELESQDGRTVVSESKNVGNASKQLELPLKDRIAQTDEGAMIRLRLEKAQRNEPYNEGEATDEAIAQADDAVVEQMVDDLINKIMKDL